RRRKPLSEDRGNCNTYLWTHRYLLAADASARGAGRTRTIPDRHASPCLGNGNSFSYAAYDWIRGNGAWKAVSYLFDYNHSGSYVFWHSYSDSCPAGSGKPAYADGRNLGTDQY